ncbi:unnamed protein product, partial [Rhizoctonia solani]
ITKELALLAYTELFELHSEEPKSNYQKWFGTAEQSHLTTVRAQFAKIIQQTTSLQTTRFTYACRLCDFKTGSGQEWMIAYINAALYEKINLCAQFWTQPSYNTGSQAGTLIRAFLQFTEHGRTPDFYITPAEVITLAHQNPERAISNAESYKYL